MLWIFNVYTWIWIAGKFKIGFCYSQKNRSIIPKISSTLQKMLQDISISKLNSYLHSQAITPHIHPHRYAATIFEKLKVKLLRLTKLCKHVSRAIRKWQTQKTLSRHQQSESILWCEIYELKNSHTDMSHIKSHVEMVNTPKIHFITYAQWDVTWEWALGGKKSQR